jgi:valyl-tRNA synthetase
MKKIIIDKSYDPSPVEEKWSDFWIKKKIFVADSDSKKKRFSIVLPPPNVTGSLHVGHALCFTLPDIIVRWKRMQGFNVLWLPGTDHASIAVHNVVEQTLAEKGLTREKIGREEFLKYAWDWKKKYGGYIIQQLKKLGFSLDWTRERFTMDEGFSRAVRQVFVDLYQEGLVYRDYYLVNRCPRCATVLSDIEIEHKDLSSQLYFIEYPFVERAGGITVATTRPETMLGDTAVAVHPEDERYKPYHGMKLRLPLVGRQIPVITDERVEVEFGTGAVKVTPAHDPVDFELGKTHQLEQVIVIDGAGKMTKEAGAEFEGMDRFECREKVVALLQEQKFLKKTEEYQHAVGHCYRCKTISEPHLSWQWFVKIAPLAKEAIRVVEEGEIRFIPSNWAKTYFEWMYNIHDWCISRQLWWGHRIPAWYCQGCDQVIVSFNPPSECPECQGDKLVQDDDVLDTWFSSALWPFGTMGWPEKTKDLQAFYPTTLMSTGFDIIFFWVARMIMMGLKFMGDIPFREVFINGLVRDFKRRKMSKSEGNVVDPIEMIETYGTDALRFTLAALAVPGMDISLSEERMAGYRAFVNKIWNASRFVLMNLEKGESEEKAEELTLTERWIRSRLARVISELNLALEEYKFYEAADKLYHFVWHEFCDWYLELVKPALIKENRTSKAVLLDSLDQILRLLHPFMPFVTEEVWHHLPSSGTSLALAPFPQAREEWVDEESERTMKQLQDLIVEIRTIRAENRIPPKQKISLWLKSSHRKELDSVIAHKDLVKVLANVQQIDILEEFEKRERFLKGVSGSLEVGIPLEKGQVDLEQERKRLEKEIKKLDVEIQKIETRLKNEDFMKRAPADVIRKNQDDLKTNKIRKEKLATNLDHLGSLG